MRSSVQWGLGGVALVLGVTALWPRGSSPARSASTPEDRSHTTYKSSTTYTPAPAATPLPEPDTVSLAPPLAVALGLLSWENQIARVLATTAGDRAQAQMLLALLPNLPEEALATATEEAIARLHDPDYGLALPLLTSPRTHGAVLSVLFADLLRRPDEIALPALRAVAANPAHPFAASARDDLALLSR